MTHHYVDVIMSAMTSQITSVSIVYSTVYWDADQRKHQSSASLAIVCGIHRWPVNSLHKWPVTRKMIPFDDVIIIHTALQWQRQELEHKADFELTKDSPLRAKYGVSIVKIWEDMTRVSTTSHNITHKRHPSWMIFVLNRGGTVSSPKSVVFGLGIAYNYSFLCI